MLSPITVDTLHRESDRLAMLSTQIGKLYRWGATHKHAMVLHSLYSVMDRMQTRIAMSKRECERRRKWMIISVKSWRQSQTLTGISILRETIWIMCVLLSFVE